MIVYTDAPNCPTGFGRQADKIFKGMGPVTWVTWTDCEDFDIEDYPYIRDYIPHISDDQFENIRHALELRMHSRIFIFNHISILQKLKDAGLEKILSDNIEVTFYCTFEFADECSHYHQLIHDMVDNLISPSSFVHDTLYKYGHESELIYHCVDRNDFDDVDRTPYEIRRGLGIPVHKDVFLYVANNTPRKNIQEAIDITSTQNAHLHIHTDHIDCDEDHVTVTEIGQHNLGELYTMCDYYLSTSKGEGFGLPYIEAKLHNKPVIAPNNSASKEHADFFTPENDIYLFNQNPNVSSDTPVDVCTPDWQKQFESFI